MPYIGKRTTHFGIGRLRFESLTTLVMISPSWKNMEQDPRTAHKPEHALAETVTHVPSQVLKVRLHLARPISHGF